MFDSALNKDKAKKVVGKTANTTIKITKHFVRWVFFLLVIYISGVTVYGYIVSGSEFLTSIITLSVGGFWAFFFGYFGWRLGQSIEEYFLNR